MEASKAREISNQNKPKLIEAIFFLTKTKINNVIHQAAKVGEFSTNAQLNLPIDTQEDVINQLVTHYEKLGYKVNVHDFFTAKTFQISWDEY